MEFVANKNPLLLQESQVEQWRETGVTLGFLTDLRDRSESSASLFVARLRFFFSDAQRVMRLLDVPSNQWDENAGHAERILDYLVQRAESTEAFYISICYFEGKVFTKLFTIPFELPSNFVLIDPKPVIAER